MTNRSEVGGQVIFRTKRRFINIHRSDQGTPERDIRPCDLISLDIPSGSRLTGRQSRQEVHRLRMNNSMNSSYKASHISKYKTRSMNLSKKSLEIQSKCSSALGIKKISKKFENF